MELQYEKIKVFKITGRNFDRFIKDNYKKFGLKSARFEKLYSWQQIDEDNVGCSTYMSYIIASEWQRWHEEDIKFCKREHIYTAYENMHDPNYHAVIDIKPLMIYLVFKGHLEEGYYYFSEYESN